MWDKDKAEKDRRIDVHEFCLVLIGFTNATSQPEQLVIFCQLEDPFIAFFRLE